MTAFIVQLIEAHYSPLHFWMDDALKGNKRNSTYMEKRKFSPKQCKNEPIDVVYTWVNGSDPDFEKALKKYVQKESGRYKLLMNLLHSCGVCYSPA